MATVTSPVKRGRGRPRKYSASDIPAVVKEKRPRGRPRKEDSQTGGQRISSGSISSTTFASGGAAATGAMAANTTVNVPEKRSRGRPRKDGTMAVARSSNPSTTSKGSDAPGTRALGRPRKVSRGGSAGEAESGPDDSVVMEEDRGNESDTEAQPMKKKTRGRPRKDQSFSEQSTGTGTNEIEPAEIGRVCPNFTLVTDETSVIGAQDLYGGQGVIIFMYPRANTSGCTKQAIGFNNNYDRLRQAGYTVVGLSGDTPTAQANWRDKLSLKYNLLCDPNHRVLRAFGASKGGKKITRSHAVIAKGGKVLAINVGVSPDESVSEALKTVGAI